MLCENVFTRRTMLGPIAAPGGSVFALLVLIVLALIGDYPLLIMLIVSSTPPLWEASPKKYLIVSFLSLVCFFTCMHCLSCLELKSRVLWPCVNCGVREILKKWLQPNQK